MCACDMYPSGVCPRHEGSTDDWRLWDQQEPSSAEEREQQRQEHAVTVVNPALDFGR